MIRQVNPEWEEFEHHPKLLNLIPENDALEALPMELWETLTPLEKVVVWWHFTRGGLDIVRIQLFPELGNVPMELLVNVWRRQAVRDTCKKIRKLNPFLSLYSADYFVELIHEEVELLRARTRVIRNITNKEKDELEWRKNEREDVQTLIKCLELIQKFTEVKKDVESPDAGNVPSRLDGIFSNAEKLIADAEKRNGSPGEEDTADTA